MFGLLRKLMDLKKPRPIPGPFANHKTIDDAEVVMARQLRTWMQNREGSSAYKLLDVGGGDGKKVAEFLGDAGTSFETYVLDLEKSEIPNHICMDITKSCHEQYREYFDVVYSYNAFEHFCNPLAASDNIGMMLKNGGLCLIHTVFSWRYHPVPSDYFRFTDDALKYMFTERNGLTCLNCGYDISRRRENIVGGFFGEYDVPPIDHYGGFRENWSVYYVGIKNG